MKTSLVLFTACVLGCLAGHALGQTRPADGPDCITLPRTDAHVHADGSSVCLDFCCNEDIHRLNYNVTLFYTQYADQPPGPGVALGAVWKLTVNVDESRPNPHIVQPVPPPSYVGDPINYHGEKITDIAGADGIIESSHNPNLLYIGGQFQQKIYFVNDQTNTVDGSISTPGTSTAYHLVEIEAVVAQGVPNILCATGIPGQLSCYDIDQITGAVSNPSLWQILGDEAAGGVLTSIIQTPNNGFYYTVSNEVATTGVFGKAAMDFLNKKVTTTRLFYNGTGSTDFPGAHGGHYDPYTEHIMLFGDNKLTQYDPATDTLIGVNADMDPARTQFDQGAFDGRGRLYLANNAGGLLWYSYRFSRNIQFPDAQGTIAEDIVRLDDVAPVVGPLACAF